MSENNSSKTELFESVYARYHDSVFAYILVSLDNDRDMAGDCMQDVAALVMKKMDIVLSHPNPGGFFIVTAKNYIHKYRAQRRRLGQTIPLDESIGAAYIEDFDALFDGPVNVDKLKQEVLSKLDDKEFELYSMFYEKKFTVRKIAGSLQISEGNVKVRLFRLRAKVREMVSALFPKQGR